MVESFNLDPPPGFRGLDPDLPIRRYYRHLPHYRQEGATYFVTFRLGDSIPAEQLEYLKSLKKEFEATRSRPDVPKEWDAFAKQIFALVDKWLDAGHGSCWFKQDRFARELIRAILHFQNQRYFVSSYVVMANHCHLTIRPFSGFDLEAVLGSIKSVVAHFINRSTGRDGNLWQQESFDRIIRDEEHLYRVIQYIGNNPRNAGLPPNRWRRWVHPDWERLGWGFREP